MSIHTAHMGNTYTIHEAGKRTDGPNVFRPKVVKALREFIHSVIGTAPSLFDAVTWVKAHEQSIDIAINGFDGLGQFPTDGHYPIDIESYGFIPDHVFQQAFNARRDPLDEWLDVNMPLPGNPFRLELSQESAEVVERLMGDALEKLDEPPVIAEADPEFERLLAEEEEIEAQAAMQAEHPTMLGLVVSSKIRVADLKLGDTIVNCTDGQMSLVQVDSLGRNGAGLVTINGHPSGHGLTALTDWWVVTVKPFS